MKQKILDLWHSQTYFWAACALLVVVWTPVVGSFIESALFPVVSKFEVTKIDVQKDRVLLSGRMYKPEYRAGCEFGELVATKNKVDQELIFKRFGEKVYTRSWGWSSFVNWRINGENISHIKLTARHRCHALWSTSTDVWVAVAQPFTIAAVLQKEELK